MGELPKQKHRGQTPFLEMLPLTHNVWGLGSKENQALHSDRFYGQINRNTWFISTLFPLFLNQKAGEGYRTRGHLGHCRSRWDPS